LEGYGNNRNGDGILDSGYDGIRFSGKWYDVMVNFNLGFMGRKRKIKHILILRL